MAITLRSPAQCSTPATAEVDRLVEAAGDLSIADEAAGGGSHAQADDSHGFPLVESQSDARLAYQRELQQRRAEEKRDKQIVGDVNQC